MSGPLFCYLEGKPDSREKIHRTLCIGGWPDEHTCPRALRPEPHRVCPHRRRRTAMYDWLLARATGGQFILRIEDTDRNRYVPDPLRILWQHLRWLGLQWDEGPGVGGPCGPYLQSERLPLYREHADRLITEGKAYYCFLHAERLAALAPGAGGGQAAPGLRSALSGSCPG